MLRQETIRKFRGFGDGNRIGEYFYSQGMNKSQFGIKPDWKIMASKDSASLAALTLITWFAQRAVTNGDIYNYGVGNTGKLFRVAQNTTTWAEVSHTTVGYGNGLGIDTESNVIIAGKQYLCKINPAGTVSNNWKDLGADEGTMWRPIERYEDTMLIGNKNLIATYTGDGTDFATNTITFPAGFSIRCIKSGQGGILIGMNFGNSGVLALWDNYSDRAIAPWLWFNEPIKSIAKYKGQWIVAVGDKFIITNGYTSKHLCFAPDSKIHSTRFIMNHTPDCMVVKDNYLMVAGGQGHFTRRQQGLWIYNLDTKLWNFVAVSNGVTYNTLIGAINIDDAYNMHVSYETSLPAKKYIGRIYNDVPPEAYFITAPLGKGNNKKTAEGLIINLGFDTVNYTYYAAPTWSIKASIYDFKRQLWTYGYTRAISTDKSILKVDGSVANYNKAEVGDEVTIVAGANAGEKRYIESIANEGTNTEEWTVDSDFSELTEASVYMIVSPFIKIGDITVATPKIKENYFYLPIKQAPTGKKFMIKIYFTATSMVPEISSLSFLYDDLGHI
jgi:hypothetical protein